MASKPVVKPRPCAPVKTRTVYEDSVQTYHTEDTPANISHAGSHSDLSVLTVPGHLEEGSGNSSDTENILNECIHSGMPQVTSVVTPIFALNNLFATRFPDEYFVLSPS